MATERTVERPDGSVERTTENGGAPVIVERRGGGGMGAIVALVIGLALVLIIGWFLMNMNRNDAVESNAVAGAADSIGNAADSVGDAVENVAPAPAPAPSN